MNSKTTDAWIVKRELATVELGEFEKYRDDFEAYALDNAEGDVELAKCGMICFRDEPEYRKEILGY